jgi:hypothetical protein
MASFAAAALLVVVLSSPVHAMRFSTEPPDNSTDIMENYVVPETTADAPSPVLGYCDAVYRDGWTILTTVHGRDLKNAVGCAVFREAVQMLAGGLRALGFKVNTLCCNLGTEQCEGGARRVFGRQVIVLGFHVLAASQPFPMTPGVPVLPARAVPVPDVVSSGWLPADAVMYQMEYIGKGLRAGYEYIVYGDYIGHLRHFRVWEYSAYNADNLWRDHDVVPSLCPLGYVSELVFPEADVVAAREAGAPIPALFYGTHPALCAQAPGEVYFVRR